MSKASPRRQPLPRRGRARGAAGHKALVQRIAREKRMVKIDGKSRRVTTADALVLVLIVRAAKDDKAYEMLQDLRAKFGDTLLSGGGCMLAPEPLADEEWIAREMEKNKYRERPVLPHELVDLDEAETQAAAEVSPEEKAFGDLTFDDLLRR